MRCCEYGETYAGRCLRGAAVVTVDAVSVALVAITVVVALVVVIVFVLEILAVVIIFVVVVGVDAFLCIEPSHGFFGFVSNDRKRSDCALVDRVATSASR